MVRLEIARLVGLNELGSGYSFRYSEGESSWTLFITDKLKDVGAVHAKLEEKSAKDTSNGKYKVSLAGERVVGFQTFDEKWAPEQQKIVEKQVDELVKAMEGK